MFTKESSKITPRTADIIADFGVIIPVDEVLTATLYWPDIHINYFAPPLILPPSPKELPSIFPPCMPIGMTAPAATEPDPAATPLTPAVENAPPPTADPASADHAALPTTPQPVIQAAATAPNGTTQTPQVVVAPPETTEPTP